MSLPQVVKPVDPVLLDKLIGEVQDDLALNLTWLTHAFGKSQKLVTKKDRKTYTYPGIFIQGTKYIDALPSSEYGNFCFFIVSDPQKADFQKNRFNTLKADVSVVFWFDLSKVSTSTDRRIEAVKAEIIEVLTRKLRLKSGRFSFVDILEDAKEIYREYSIDEIDTQFLMQPYCGLRFKGEMLLREGINC